MNGNDPLGASPIFPPRVATSAAPSNPAGSPRLDSSHSSQRQRWQQAMEQSQCRDWFKAPPSAKPALLTRSTFANSALPADPSTPSGAETALDSHPKANLTHPRIATLENQSPAASPTVLSHANGWSARSASGTQPQPQSQQPSSPTSALRTAHLAGYANPTTLEPQTPTTAITDAQVSALLAQVSRGTGNNTPAHEANTVRVSWQWSRTASAVAVWLGVPRARQAEIPQLTQQLQTALQTANVALASLVCNGARLFPLDQPES